MLATYKELASALENLQRMQKRLECYPPCHVVINDRFEFDMGPDSENELRCYMPEDQLAEVLGRDAHWNNLEIGCLIEFFRVGPYLPDVHTMLSYFHIPRPSH